MQHTPTIARCSSLQRLAGRVPAFKTGNQGRAVQTFSTNRRSTDNSAPAFSKRAMLGLLGGMWFSTRGDQAVAAATTAEQVLSGNPQYSCHG